MLKEQPRHIVLISGSGADSKSVAAIMASMRLTGAIPMLVSDHPVRLGADASDESIKKQAVEDVSKADGIIVMGNDLDIDPKDYGDPPCHAKTRSEKVTPQGRVRAEYEYCLIEEALRLKVPCFGVCGGMQRINVLLGGTLHQHVPDLVGTAYHHQGDMGIAPFIPVQYVAVVPGTKLAAISKELGGLFTPQHERLPPGVFMENSFHHQAVDKVGEGLMPCAFSVEPDKPGLHIVQAIEAAPDGPYKDQFVLGVQWHPEFGASDVSVRSLQEFNAEMHVYAKTHTRKISAEEALAITANNMGGNKWKGYEESASVDWSEAIKSTLNTNPKKPGGRSR